MAQPSYRDIINDIKKGESIVPVYLLFGEEAFYIDKIIEAFEKYLIPEEDRDFNYNVYYGNDAEMERVVATAQQFPVMAERKLVILKEAQSAYMAKQQLEKLAPYVSRPNPTTVFVVAFKGESPALSSEIMKAAKKSDAIVFKSAVPKDWELPVLLKDYCSSLGMNADEKTIHLLCDYIGAPLSKLFGEIDKLSMILGKGSRITPDDVERNIGISKDYNNFEFSKAIASKNYSSTMRILDYFKKNPKPNPSVMIIATVFNLFQRITICHFLNDKSDKSMMDALGLKSSYALREIKDAMRNYNPYQSVMAIHYIREMDTKSKGIGSYQKEYDLMTDMIFKIFTT